MFKINSEEKRERKIRKKEKRERKKESKFYDDFCFGWGGAELSVM